MITTTLESSLDIQAASGAEASLACRAELEEGPDCDLIRLSALVANQPIPSDHRKTEVANQIPQLDQMDDTTGVRSDVIEYVTLGECEPYTRAVLRFLLWSSLVTVAFAFGLIFGRGGV